MPLILIHDAGFSFSSRASSSFYTCLFSVPGVVDVQSMRKGRSDRDYARTELHAYCDVVVVYKAAFAESDCERGFSAAAVAQGDDFGYVVPRLGHFARVCVYRGGICMRKALLCGAKAVAWGFEMVEEGCDDWALACGYV